MSNIFFVVDIGIGLSQVTVSFFTTLVFEATHLAVSKTITCFHIRAINHAKSQGVLQFGVWSYPCILGRLGRAFRKREGDGKSPFGVFEVRTVAYRADRVRRPQTLLEVKLLTPDLGWCDDTRSGSYNRPVKLPFKPGHEELWRGDSSYDFLAPTSHNQCPRVKGLGSAIFLHLARPGQTGTEGCIALSERNLRILLARCGAKTLLKI